MRLRPVAALAASTLALLCALPVAASAAEQAPRQGEFAYSYTDLYSTEARTETLRRPAPEKCHPLPEVELPWTAPAHTPQNRTAGYALVYTGAHCDGKRTALPPQTAADEDVTFRSVRFP